MQAADSLPLPTAEDIPDPDNRRRARLATLRARPLVATLRATALRVGDVCNLDRNAVAVARGTGGYLRVRVAKTEHAAHVVLGQRALHAIDVYLAERSDWSPWIFIQHGRTGSPPHVRQLSSEAYRRRKRGYGARISPGFVRGIVVGLARDAGYDPDKDQFVSTHAFRHWHAQRMVDQGASIDDVQSVLGHARSETTREVYAPEPNIPRIIDAEKEIQS